MIDEDLQEQIDFWNERVYPILDFDEAFTKWLEFCVHHGVDRSSGQKPPYNVGKDLLASDTNFSIKEDPLVQNKVDTGRCFSAIYDPASELKEEFNSFASEFVDAENKIDLDTCIAYALGIDAESNEKKLYYVKNSKYVEAFTYVNNELIESKNYERDTIVHSIWRCEGERGSRKRTGLIPETDRPTREGLETLSSVNLMYERSRSLAASILNSELFYLDNISQSNERGTALYFD
jgi:hypothetical protein